MKKNEKKGGRKRKRGLKGGTVESPRRAEKLNFFNQKILEKLSRKSDFEQPTRRKRKQKKKKELKKNWKKKMKEGKKETSFLKKKTKKKHKKKIKGQKMKENEEKRK